MARAIARTPLAWGLALAACCALLAMAIPAAGTVPPKNCGGIQAAGKSYKVKSHKTKCRFAKRWSRKFLADGKKPDGWQCERYGKRSSIAMSCRKPGKDFFAIRD